MGTERRTKCLACGIVMAIVVLMLSHYKEQLGLHFRSLYNDEEDKKHESSVINPSKQTTGIFSNEELQYFEFGIGNEADFNSKLYKYIQQEIIHPSKFRPPEEWHRKDFSQYGQSKVIDNILEQRKNGFFVECGALDGLEHSNTAFLELERNWTGLLIEADPRMRRHLLNSGRRASMLMRCLSPIHKPLRTRFRLSGGVNGLSDFAVGHISPKRRRLSDTMLTCFPFNSVMEAFGRRHIDFFSLDVEGAELDILKTIDFQSIRIDLFLIEYALTPLKSQVQRSQEKLQEIRKLFQATKLYTEVAIINIPKYKVGLDVIFKRIS